MNVLEPSQVGKEIGLMKDELDGIIITPPPTSWKGREKKLYS